MDESDEISSSLRDRVYFAARDGFTITLYALLSEHRSIAKQLLNEPVEDEDGQFCTPLIIAAKNGHEKVMKTLLSSFSPDLEVEGMIKFDNFVIEGATALWVSAAAGHLPLVKILVHAGSNVNHATKSSSTPLRAACFDGRLDIVKYLVEHGADIHIANKYNNTCLMIASYKGHVDIVNYLLENGANANSRANCGASAMHFAADCGHLDVVKELLQYGACLLCNENGMSQLLSAAERTKPDVVEFLLTQPDLAKSERIDALELLGASFANDKDSYSLEKAYHYLRQAMELRFSDPDDVVEKPVACPVPAYENWIETRSLEELERIRDNSNALHMESLVIRERILGRRNPEVPHPLIFRGAVFADSARFDRCVELWLHALTLRQENNLSVTKDLLRFAQVFSQMVHVGFQLEFDHIKQVLAAAVWELTRNKEKLESPDPKDDVDQILDEVESKMSTALYILVIVTQMIKENVSEDVRREDNVLSIYKIVYQLVKLNLRTRNNETLLHLCVNYRTPVDDFHTNDVCKFPSSSVAKLLIDCGADVDAMDSGRNTPLHVIVSYQRPVSDFMTLHSIIMDLIKAGAHIDPVNRNGETPLEAATTGVAEIILQTQTHIKLKCIAAKVVKTYDLTYEGKVPKALESFIELHGSGVRQG